MARKLTKMVFTGLFSWGYQIKNICNTYQISTRFTEVATFDNIIEILNN